MYAASPKQIAFIKRLLDQRQVADETADRAWTLLEAHDIDVRTPGDGSLIPMAVAGRMIDHLLDQPWKPSEGQRQDGSAAGVGVYRHDGELFVVREFTPQGESRIVRYCRKIVTLTDGQGDRLNQDGEHIRTEEEKAPRMQFTLTDDELLSVEDVEKLSVQFSYCLICGKHLRVAKSVETGIGPVCRKNYAGRLAAA